MSTNPNAIGFSYLSDQLPRGLLLGAKEGLSDFLICHNGHGKFAVGLDRHARFRVIELGPVNNAWRGCLVGDVEVLVDEGTWFTSHVRDPRPGDIVLTRGKVWIAVEAPITTPYHLVEWGTAVAMGYGELVGGFSSWKIVRQQGAERHELKSVSSERGSVEIIE